MPNIYDAVVVSNMALGDTKVNGNVSELIKNRNVLEETMYRILTRECKNDQERKTSVVQYPRCNYCQEQVANIKDNVQIANVGIGSASYGQLAIEQTLKVANVDAKPLEKLRDLDATIASEQKKGNNISALLQSRNEVVDKAAKVLSDGLGVEQKRIKSYLGTMPDK